MDSEDADVTPEQIRLKNGYLWVTRDSWKKILHSPPVVKAVKARAQEICDFANAHASVPGARYKVTFEQDEEKLNSYTRFRAFVRPANAEAKLDAKDFNTLYNAMNYEPFNDPMPPSMPAPPGAEFEFPPYED